MYRYSLFLGFEATDPRGPQYLMFTTDTVYGVVWWWW